MSGNQRETGSERPDRKSETGSERPDRKSETGSERPDRKSETGSERPDRKSETGSERPDRKSETGSERPDRESETGSERPDRKSETGSERPDRESATDGDETLTVDNLASSEVAQPGNDNDVNIVPQGSIRFLYESVQAQQVLSTEIENPLHIIYVSDAYYDTVASRLADAVAKGNYSMSITHPILKNKQIVDKVFQMLKLKKPNMLKGFLNTKDIERLAMLHAKEKEKYLLYWAVHAHSLYLVEKILDVGNRFSDKEINEAFKACASCGNEAVLLLLSSKYKSLLHQSDLNEALVTATENNHKDVALALLNIGADVYESKSDAGENVFQIAMKKGFRQLGSGMFSYISKRLNMKDLTGDFDFHRAAYSALCYSCTVGDITLLQFFLPVTDINASYSIGRTLSFPHIDCLEGLTPLAIAAAYGQKNVFKMLVSKGADLTLRDDNNNTVLHAACEGGNSSIVEDLLPLFDIDCRGQLGLTPLMRAAFCGKKAVFDMLVSKGADLILRYDVNDTILHLACQGGNSPIVEYLLPLFDINCLGRKGFTPLMRAAVSGNHNIWEFLLINGGNRVCVGDDNHTTLHTACRGGNMLIVEDVIDDFDINTKGLYGRTPLLEAVRGGHILVFDFFVSRNADVKTVDNDGNNLLHVACIGGHLGMVKHVCQWLNIDDRDVRGWTPAMAAAVFGKSAVFDYLRRQGAYLTRVDKTGDDLFTLALQGGCRQIIERLSPDGQYVKKHTPWTRLMRSAVRGIFEILKLCHENSPELVQTDQFGDTLLHLACRGGNRKCVEYLLPFYDINVRGQYSWTPVMMAAVCGHDDIFQLLVDNKADLSLLSYTGVCIFTLAQRGQSNDIVEYLRNK